MKITDLTINPCSLGRRLLLVDVTPAYTYSEGKRTNNIMGYRYTIAMPEHGFDKLSVRIDGKQQLEAPNGYVEVTFQELEVYIYWTPTGYQVGARAKGIKAVPGDTGIKA